MRITTHVGLVLGVAIVVFAIRAKGGDLSLFKNYVALLVCLGGTVAATTVSSSRLTVLHALSAMKKLLWESSVRATHISDQMVALARQVRADGASAIDPEAMDLRDP